MRNVSSREQFKNSLKPAWLFILLLALWVAHPSPSCAGESAEPAVAEITAESSEPAEISGVEHMEEAEEHLSPDAPAIFNMGAVPVTNSMITGWLAALIIVFASIRFNHQVRAGRNTLFTVAIESLVLFLDGFLSDIMGKKLAKQTLWLLGSFFIYILGSNLLGLFPGIGSVGWGAHTGHMFKVATPLFRGVNADLNTTLALGALFFIFWFIWSWKANGPVGIIKHIFGFKGEAAGVMHVVMVVVFLAVGLLEILSILIRPFSLALRLYGNIFAGEVVLDTMLHKLPYLGWLLPIPFYLMEVLVGLIQAMVFTLLSAVFIMLMCDHGDENEEHPDSGADALKKPE